MVKRNIKTVVIDYGHGGIDPSNGRYTTAPSKQAVVNGEMVHEGVINRDIGRRLFDALASDGYNVVETVKAFDHTDLSLSSRVRIANKVDNAIFISIHCNAFNGKARGFEVWTTIGQNNSDILAECIAESLEPMEHKGLVMRFDTWSDDDKDKEKDFYVIKFSKHPSVLVECFFFDNAKDLELYNDKVWLNDFISSLKNGIIDYINGKV